MTIIRTYSGTIHNLNAELSDESALNIAIQKMLAQDGIVRGCILTTIPYEKIEQSIEPVYKVTKLYGLIQVKEGDGRFLVTIMPLSIKRKYIKEWFKGLYFNTVSVICQDKLLPGDDRLEVVSEAYMRMFRLFSA